MKVSVPQKFGFGAYSKLPLASKLLMVPLSGASYSWYEIVPHELISVAVTTPVIERVSSVPVAKAGSVTGGVLLVTTSAV